MANYCSNTMYIENATIKGSEKFYELLKDGGIEAPNQWLFDIDIDIDIDPKEAVHRIAFTTKWSLHEESIEFMLNLLEAESIYCYYDEPGMGLAGKIMCNSDATQDYNVIQEYWEDCEKAYKNEEDPPEIEDYLTPEKCLINRFENLISSLMLDTTSDPFSALYAAYLYLSRNHY